MKKQIIIMTSIIVVLGLIGIIAFNASLGQRTKKRLNVPLLGKIAVKDIHTIIVDDTTVISTQDGEWVYVDTVQGTVITRAARQDHVEELITNISEAYRGRLVDSDPKEEDLEKYFIDNDLGRHNLVIKNSKDEEIFSVLLGIVFSAPDQNYVQIDGNKEVYLITGNVINILNKGREYWLDLRLFPEEDTSDDTIVSVSIERKNSPTLSFKKEESEWVSDAKEEIEADLVEQYVRRIKNLEGTGFATPNMEKLQEEGIVQVTGDNNFSFTVYRLDSLYYAKVKGLDMSDLFELDKKDIAHIFPASDYFIKQ